MLLVYIDRSSPRIDYTFQLMLKDIAGLDYRLTSDEHTFRAFDGAKCSYGYQSFEGVQHVQAFGLLHEEGIRAMEVPVVDHQGIACPFPVNGSTLFPFDVFSAAFYLVTRYEEYLAKDKDEHGRYRAVDSLAYRLGFLTKPVVNQWALALRYKLVNIFPALSYRSSSYRYISTIDVDQAYAYKAKGAWRNLGGLARDLKQGQWADVWERLSVLFLGQPDPFDTFNGILSLNRKHDGELHFFLHLGDRGPYDKSLTWNHAHMKKLVQKLSARGLLGIHPSYASLDQQVLHQECMRFKSLTQQLPKRSRQHYLRLSFPHTYQALLAESVEADYSMGYADQVGFRASTCTPFWFYDVSKEEVTGLRVYPFALMDGTLKDYMHLSTPEAIQVSDQLLKEVKAVDGLFMSIWHNHSLNGQREWSGWDLIYEKMTTQATCIA
jgi:hypothetical protein